MNRNEQIKQAAFSRFCLSQSTTFGLQCDSFEEGAKWADEHPCWKPNVKQMEVLERLILEERGVEQRADGANLFFARTLESLHHDLMNHFINNKTY